MKNVYWLRRCGDGGRTFNFFNGYAPHIDLDPPVRESAPINSLFGRHLQFVESGKEILPDLSNRDLFFESPFSKR